MSAWTLKRMILQPGRINDQLETVQGLSLSPDHGPQPCSSKCGWSTGSLSITSDLIGNAESWALPQIHRTRICILANPQVIHVLIKVWDVVVSKTLHEPTPAHRSGTVYSPSLYLTGLLAVAQTQQAYPVSRNLPGDTSPSHCMEHLQGAPFMWPSTQMARPVAQLQSTTWTVSLGIGWPSCPVQGPTWVPPLCRCLPIHHHLKKPPMTLFPHLLYYSSQHSHYLTLHHLSVCLVYCLSFFVRIPSPWNQELGLPPSPPLYFQHQEQNLCDNWYTLAHACALNFSAK